MDKYNKKNKGVRNGFSHMVLVEKCDEVGDDDDDDEKIDILTAMLWLKPEPG